MRISILFIFILSFFNDIHASTLEEYESKAQNAVVIVYGKSQDGEIYTLLAHDKRCFWTPPGGKREAKHRTILDTAAEELFEETAAFDLFKPEDVKLLLKKQPVESVFTYNGHTDLFALNIGKKIDECRNISTNYKERIKGKSRSFDEMSGWNIFNINYLFDSFKTNPRRVNKDIIINEIGPLKNYVFNSFSSFYHSGILEKMMRVAPDLSENQEQIDLLTYWERFLPEMANGFKDYNKGDPSVARLNDFEILKILFPGVKKEGEYPDLETAKQKFADLAKAGRSYAQGFNPPQADAVLPLVKTAYDEYFKNFLPEMVKGFKDYNKGDPSIARLNDFEILKKLFPSVKKEGEYPDLETAKQKFADLAKAGRPYARGFNPLQADAVLPLVKTAYDEYFKNFLPEMVTGFKDYNKGDAKVSKMSNFEILKILFPDVKKEGDYPNLETAKQRFTALAKAGRPYAQGFNPPE
jgi:hypothetical protein